MWLDNLFAPIARILGWLILVLYDLVNNYALALVLVAILIHAVMLPFQMKAKRGMLRQTRISPKIAELQKKHGANKQKLNEEMAKLYKEEGVNPASGCFWNLIPMPIMMAIFVAIRQPMVMMMNVSTDLIGNLEDGLGVIGQRLYDTGYVFTPGNFHEQASQLQWITNHWEQFSEFASYGLRQMSFYLTGDFMNLAQVPPWQLWNPEYFNWSDSTYWLPALLLFSLPILSGVAQFISADIMRKMNAQPQAPSGGMGTVMKMMPLMSVFFGFMLPAVLSIYWTAGTVLRIGQDIWLTKKYTKILDEEDFERDKVRKVKEAELEAKRLETERKKAEGIVETNKNKSKNKKKKGDRQEKLEKAAEWEKKNAPPESAKTKKKEPGRVGDRKFARGRAYNPDRYKRKGKKSKDESTDDIEEFDVVQDVDEVEDIVDTENVDESAESVDNADDNEDDYVDDEDDEDDYEDDDIEDGDEDDSDDDYEEDDDFDDEEGDDEDDFEDEDDDSESPQTTRFDTKRFDD